MLQTTASLPRNRRGHGESAIRPLRFDLWLGTLTLGPRLSRALRWIQAWRREVAMNRGRAKAIGALVGPVGLILGLLGYVGG